MRDSEIKIRLRLAMQLLDMLSSAAGIRQFETRDLVSIIGLFVAGNGPGHFISQESP